MEEPAVECGQTGEQDQQGGESQPEDGEGEEERRDEQLQEMFDCSQAASHLQPRVHSLAEVSLQRSVGVPATVGVTRDTARVRIRSIEVRLPVLVSTGAENSTALVPGLQAVPQSHHTRILDCPAQCCYNIHLVQLVLYVGLHHEAEDHGHEDYDEN